MLLRSLSTTQQAPTSSSAAIRKIVLKALPFPVEVDDFLPERSEFVVRVHFGQEVQDEVVQLVEQRFRDWDSVVRLGGYHDDFAELREPALDPTETHRMGPESIEHRIRAWNAPLMALEGLINIVVKLHHTNSVAGLQLG